MTEAVAESIPVELSRTQELIWAAQRLHPDAPLSNMANRFRLRGAVDPGRLVRAFHRVVEECDVLRMTIGRVGGERTAAFVHHAPPSTTEVIELPLRDLEDWTEARISVPIGVDRATYDSVLIRHADDDWTWWLNLHHVATDAWSSALIFAATSTAYERLDPSGEARSEGDESDIDLADVIDGRYFDATAGSATSTPPGDSASVPLTPYGERDVETTSLERNVVPLGVETWRSLDVALDGAYRSLNRDLGLLALAAMSMAIWVHRTDGRREVVIDLPVHHRSSATSKRLVGPTMEFTSITVEVESSDSHLAMFKRVLRSVMVALSAARPGQSASSRSGLAVNVVTARYGDFADIATTRRWIRSGHGDPNQLVGCQLFATSDSGDDTSIDTTWEIEVNGALGPVDALDRLPDHLAAVIRAVVDAPDATVSTTSLVTDDERDELALLNPEPTPRQIDSTVHEAIARRLRADPDWIVAEHDGEQITAARFDARADRLARWLLRNGVTVGRTVGVRMHRSIDVLVAIHAIMRAGGVFVLLDPDDPPARHDVIVADADMALLLESLPDDAASTDDTSEVGTDRTRLPDVGLDDLAYVLYTSGSTGVPKGVPISHRGLADYLAFAVESYPLEGATMALHSSIAFDLTITSLFSTLMAGGRVIIYSDDPIDALARIATEPRIDAIKVTPAQLEILCRLADEPLQLRVVVVGGEAFRRPQAVELVRRCEHPVRIFNEYGPTEAVVGCMIHEWNPELDVGVDVPIGHAAPGSAVAVLDQCGQPAPSGSWGELFVRRPGMASEYLGRPEASTHHFVTSPVLEAIAPGSWYRTGDRVRVVRAGVAVYGGRLDDQLKVNGFRLEPAEVEVALVAHPDVESAVVRLSVSDSGAETLTAWYRSTAGTDLDPDVLRRHVSSLVADHAVPAAYVRVDDMPLAASTKVDVALLPPPAAQHRSGRFVGPANDTERIVADVWAEVLGLEQVSVEDDFFSIGGASLSSIEVVAAIDDRLGTDLPDAAVFGARTVRELAALVGETMSSGSPARARAEIPPLRPDAPPPLSSSEEAMLFDHRSDPASSHYHVARLYSLDFSDGDEPLDITRLRDSFRAVVGHHQPLHTAYDRDRTVLSAERALAFRDLGSMDAEQFEAHARRSRAVPFDLDAGPLIRIDVASTGPRSWAVLVCLHHISLGVGTLDLIWQQATDHYRGLPLPDLPVTYGAHAAWQRRRIDESAREFWLERSRVRREPAAIALPTPPPITPDGYVARMLDIEPAGLAVRGHTRFAAAFAAASIALTRLTAASRIEFGIAATTKDHADVGPLIGHHLNSLPIAVDVRSDDTFADVLDRAGAEMTEAIAVRTYPFASMVRDARDEGLVVPDLRFMLAYDEMRAPFFPGAHVEQQILASDVAVTDVTVFVQERPDSIQLSVEHRGAALTAADAEMLLAMFETALLDGVSDPDQRVADLMRAFAVGPLAGAPLVDADPIVLTSIVAGIAASPEADAVIDGGGSKLSRAELARRICEVARRIDDARSAEGDARSSGRIGVLVRRSLDTVPALLGTLFAGAAYVPLDPTVGIDRLRAIVAASDLDLLVHGIGDGDRFADPGGGLLGVADARCVALPDWADAGQRSVDEAIADLSRRAEMVDPDGAAYVNFTSGSTGAPRGVVASHRNLAASTFARGPWYGGAPRRFLVTSSIGFDSSVVGLFWPLVGGGAIVLPGDDDVHDVDRLGGLISRHAVSHVLMVPTLYRALLGRRADDLEHVDVVIVAGEACPLELVVEHEAALPQVDLVNEYGPTETTVWATAERLHVATDRARSATERFGATGIPIGGPIPGVELIVAGEDLSLLPPRVAGELLISGGGVTDGYLGLPDLTAERFVVRSGRRWYRSGDRVRLVDDTVFFLGRLDDQLNVGGLRIEPTEIERVLRGRVEIDDAVVVAVDEPPRLVAHVVGDTPIDERAVRVELERHLPPAAVPSRIVRQDSLPLSPNGKIDRRAARSLPVTSSTVSPSARTSTRSSAWSDLDRLVVDAWRTALGRDDVALDTDFFDFGGNSIAAVEIVSRLGDRLDTTVPIALLLTGATPGGMSELLAESIDEAQRPNHGGSGNAIGDVFQVVDMRPGEPGGPMVLMVPSWDDVFGYQALADALPSRIAVRALACSADGPIDTVEDFVDGVIERAVDAVADRSVVAVLGWSVGGVVAVEVAAAMVERNVGVHHVALVDTLYPGEGAHLWSNRWWKYKSLLTPRGVREIGSEVRVTARRRFRQLLTTVRNRFATGDTPLDTDAPSPAVPAGASGVFPAESLDHPLAAIELPVVFYAASATNPDRTVRRWTEIADDLTVVPVTGRHRGFDSIMSVPGVDVIASDLAGRLAPLDRSD